ncbi:uncharacterized protein LOC108741993 isoform X2 [Agrilus planipennis]|uniref:Uncharacterized protein LOC108741993 isoform X2 n=1 Tax=Agrilus planipennis TaxID=224129 RepID=A0A1W4XI82_AGRPL|nr:uncharacterized protein LOC108741993 isoform X2 [Agrilus planipennis]
MPQGPATNPFMKPFVVLALPGMYLVYKYNQYRRRKKENARRKLTERELQHLNNKIDKLLTKLEESEPELATSPEEECVICIHAKATMQTAPCGHQVVCRKCFVKTIQIAVSQRLLPLRCVICRAKILRLKTGPLLPMSASGYSMSSRTSSVPQSDSLYSVSSGGSSISSTSSSSDGSGTCCGGRCLGAYPRQPTTGAIRRNQQHAMKLKLQEYCHPERSNINRLPPIKELPTASPNHNAAPPSTRIRCAQKIVTQLESVPLIRRSKNYKYVQLPQDEDFDEDANPSPTESECSRNRKWWVSKKDNVSPARTPEWDDNKKNELMEKEMVMKEKQYIRRRKSEGKSLERITTTKFDTDDRKHK